MSARRLRGRRQGSALLVAIVFTTVLLVIALGVVELSVAARRGALASGARAQAAAIAEAGADVALCGVARGVALDLDLDEAFAGGRYVVTVSVRADGSGVHDIHAVGTCGAERAVIDVAAVQSGATVVACSWVRQQ